MIAKKALRKGPFGMPELAEAAGVSIYSLRSWAAGARTPEPESLRKLAAGFRKRVEQLETIVAELEGAAEKLEREAER